MPCEAGSTAGPLAQVSAESCNATVERVSLIGSKSTRRRATERREKLHSRRRVCADVDPWFRATGGAPRVEDGENERNKDEESRSVKNDAGVKASRRRADRCVRESKAHSHEAWVQLAAFRPKREHQLKS